MPAMSEEQKAAYRGGLEREREGYEERKAAFEAGNDADGAKAMAERTKQVDGELTRIGKQSRPRGGSAESR